MLEIRKTYPRESKEVIKDIQNCFSLTQSCHLCYTSMPIKPTHVCSYYHLGDTVVVAAVVVIDATASWEPTNKLCLNPSLLEPRESK